ncbi:hypothetical protein NE235_35820 [Actinoallomurus spadix]|uniref:Uncharacterized protein n=1 Tax=Actinoallomurus spadix TaxID=79912 RepID=A0ABP3GAM9_9ACTN|nr:hypothetical protein [Actinoallomurus spadix]MCO5991497.1 hypothetical protein [Actinoallomurus spadix]
MFRSRRRRLPAGYSPEEEANIDYLKGERISPEEAARMREELARLELRVAQGKQKIAVLMAANRNARRKAAAYGAKAAAFRTAIDRRLGRYTLDVVIFALVAAAWWFGFFNVVIEGRW